jgi:hypothetical protein
MLKSTIAAGLLCLPGVASAALIFNGSFELGSFSPSADHPGDDTMVLGVGATDITGWTVINGGLAWIGPANPFGLTASQGSYFLDLTDYRDNPPYGGVAQVLIPTVAGQRYHLSFDIGSDPTYNTSGAPAIDVNLNGSFWNVFNGTIAGPNYWTGVSADFVATGTSTTLDFYGDNSVNAGKYIGLDNVQLTSVPDGGMTMSLLGVGMIGLTWVRRIIHRTA